MAYFKRGDVSIYYEVHGEGFPVLLIAPGGMRSAIEFWGDGPFNPVETLPAHFQVIAMDQRNAGRSTAPVAASDGWHTYTEDQIALLDHLGIEQAHLMGACIGGPYLFGIIQAAPDRVAAAVVQQSIGYDGNREIFYAMFQGWADAIEGRASGSGPGSVAEFSLQHVRRRFRLQRRAGFRQELPRHPCSS